MHRGMRCWVGLLLLAAACSAAQADGFRPISDIRFEGNHRTEPRILLQELTVHIGDPANPELIDESRQAIMDLGLFERVWTELDDGDEGEIVTFHMREKYYIVPLPVLDAPAGGQISYGFDLRLDNLGGLNQHLKLGYENNGSSSGSHDLERKYELEYAYPRVGGSPYDLSVVASHRHQDVTESKQHPGLVGDYLFRENRLDLAVTRWLREAGPSRGWRAGAGLSFIDHDYIYHGGTPGLFDPSHAFGLNAAFEYLDVRQLPFFRKGVAFGWQGSVGLPELGSQESYHRHLFYWRSYMPLGFDDLAPAINARLELGLATGSLFGERAFSVGGGNTLRGYPESDTGNGLLLGNIEYHTPLLKIPQLRGVLFADVGNVYREVEQIDPTNLKVGVGVGLRWRVQRFVNITLTTDLGHGLGSNLTKFYASTSASF